MYHSNIITNSSNHSLHNEDSATPRLAQNRDSKISEDIKASLYNMVYGEGVFIKDAARYLQINYNSARWVVAVYTNENMRIYKKIPL